MTDPKEFDKIRNQFASLVSSYLISFPNRRIFVSPHRRNVYIFSKSSYRRIIRLSYRISFPNHRIVLCRIVYLFQIVLCRIVVSSRCRIRIIASSYRFVILSLCPIVSVSFRFVSVWSYHFVSPTNGISFPKVSLEGSHYSKLDSDGLHNSNRGFHHGIYILCMHDQHQWLESNVDYQHCPFHCC